MQRVKTSTMVRSSGGSCGVTWPSMRSRHRLRQHASTLGGGLPGSSRHCGSVPPRPTVPMFKMEVRVGSKYAIHSVKMLGATSQQADFSR